MTDVKSATYNPGSDDAANVPMVRRVVEVHYRCPGSGQRLASIGQSLGCSPPATRQERCPTCERTAYRATQDWHDVLLDHGRVCKVVIAVPEPFNAAAQARARMEVLDLVATRPDLLNNSCAPLRTWSDPTVVWPWLEGA